MTDQKTDIWKERHAIQNARHKKLVDAMEGYDRDIYRPALTTLQERCKAAGGHELFDVGNNGFGTSWCLCNLCGARYNVVDANGNEVADD